MNQATGLQGQQDGMPVLTLSLCVRVLVSSNEPRYLVRGI